MEQHITTIETLAAASQEQFLALEKKMNTVEGTNRVIILFTSVRTEADLIGSP
jgi:hypothetical protein